MTGNWKRLQSQAGGRGARGQEAMGRSERIPPYRSYGSPNPPNASESLLAHRKDVLLEVINDGKLVETPGTGTGPASQKAHFGGGSWLVATVSQHQASPKEGTGLSGKARLDALIAKIPLTLTAHELKTSGRPLTACPRLLQKEQQPRFPDGAEGAGDGQLAQLLLSVAPMQTSGCASLRSEEETIAKTRQGRLRMERYEQAAQNGLWNLKINLGTGGGSHTRKGDSAVKLPLSPVSRWLYLLATELDLHVAQPSL